LIYLQVIEQFFFSHEAFNPQRHLFFTTTILFASMFGMAFTWKIYLALILTILLFSFVCS